MKTLVVVTALIRTRKTTNLSSERSKTNLLFIGLYTGSLKRKDIRHVAYRPTRM